MKKIYPARLPRAAYDQGRSIADVQNMYAGKPLDWELLRENKCPKCTRDLANAEYKLLGVPLKKHIVHRCGFSYEQDELSKIMAKQVNQALEDRRDDNENY